MPTHFGRARSCDMDALYALAGRHKLRVIEDAALAIGSPWQGTHDRQLRRPRARSASIRTRTSRRSRAARWSSTTSARRATSRRCASTASRACPTARATSRSPAASSTCPTSTRAIGLRQLAQLPAFNARAARSPRATSSASRTDPPCELPHRGYPATTTATAGTCSRCCCRLTRLDAHAPGSSATRWRRAASAPACRTRRCTWPRSFRRFGYHRGDLPHTERIARHDRDAAAVSRDDRRRRRPRVRRVRRGPRAAHRRVTRQRDDDRSSRSSSRSTTRRRGCRRSSRACIRRSTRSASPYEVIFVNDGSRDRSAALLKDQYLARPDVTRVVLFNANYGQHTAIIAGFERVRGERVVTLDADLQNPPEEIAQAAGGDGRRARLRRRRAPRARGRVVAARRLARDEPAARAHHAHPDDRPGLHAARLQPRHRRRRRREPRGQHVHPGARLHVRAAARPRSRSRTRSARRASRSIRCTS